MKIIVVKLYVSINLIIYICFVNIRVLEPLSFEQLIKDRETDDGTDDDHGVEKVLSPTPSSFNIGSELDWIEPSIKLCNSTNSLQVPSSDKVYEAFHLLQTEPSVQVRS